MSQVLADALALWRAGLSVIPVRRDGSKAPAVPWKRYQGGIADVIDLEDWFRDECYGIGVVCGAVSGNLIVFDFEDARACDRWLSAGDGWKADALEYCPVAETPGGGRHVYYRSPAPVPAGAKLAFDRGADGLVLVGETRGEGHFVVAPGSPADCHPSGRPYSWVRRGWLND